MPSLQKSRDVFIWRRMENNLFLTQLIRIPSIGITMYLIKFTVIYEETTKAQIPLVHSITELPPFRLLAFLTKQEIFSHANPEFPDGHSVSLLEFSHWDGRGPEFCLILPPPKTLLCQVTWMV